MSVFILPLPSTFMKDSQLEILSLRHFHKYLSKTSVAVFSIGGRCYNEDLDKDPGVPMIGSQMWQESIIPSFNLGKLSRF